MQQTKAYFYPYGEIFGLSVICVPIREHWSVGESGPTQWLDDGVHPSAEGYRLMARAVYVALTSSIPDRHDATAE
jgi:lysophospholipase L1-like esterase